MNNEEEQYVHNKYFIRRKFYIPKNESTRDYGKTVSGLNIEREIEYDEDSDEWK